MARTTFLVDRALIVRQQDSRTLGMKFKASDAEIGDWIPCRLRVPSGDVTLDRAKYSITPDYDLHLNSYDLSGISIKLSQFDTFRIYQRIDDHWVAYPQTFVIVGAIRAKRRRSRLVSYIVPIAAGLPQEA